MAELVGRYEVLSPLRAGGMGRIELARLPGEYDMFRHVVLKRPFAHHATETAVLEELRSEARLLASFHHPNVISFLDAGVDSAGVDFVALEYVHGVSLRDLSQPRGATLARPPLEVSLAIAIDVLDALEYVHRRASPDGTSLGIVHRDVSPSNVLLGYDGSVKLIDFGVAKLTEGATASGTLRGKIAYMAPEQCRGERIDRRADVYAVGIVLYELVTGRRPFHADDDVAALHKVIAGKLARPREIDPDIDARLDEILTRAIAYDPADRYATAAAFADDLEAFAAAGRLVLGNSQIAVALEGLRKPEPWRSKSETSSSRDAGPAGAVEPEKPKQRRLGRLVAVGALVAASTGVILYATRDRDHDANLATTTIEPSPPPPSPPPIKEAAKESAPPPEPVIPAKPTPDVPKKAVVRRGSAGSGSAIVAPPPPPPPPPDKPVQPGEWKPGMIFPSEPTRGGK